MAPNNFALVVDNFCVKFTGDIYANHLLKTLEQYYKVMVDWQGHLFVGIQLNWDYATRTLDTHVPGYMAGALHKFQHSPPKWLQHVPAKAKPIHYGAKVQQAEHDSSPRISTARVKCIQKNVGSFAWYAWACDLTMAATMSSIAARQSKGTENLEQEVAQFLDDYCAMHPNAGVHFVASGMVIVLHSDASYLWQKLRRRTLLPHAKGGRKLRQWCSPHTLQNYKTCDVIDIRCRDSCTVLQL